MINEKKVIAVCTSRISDNQLHNFLEQLNEYLRPFDCCVMIFALNTDLYWIEERKSPESYVFDIIPYDKIECLILMDEKIKSDRVSRRLIERASEHSCPVIVIDGKYDGTISISFDYEKGFEQVVRHVIEGHHVRYPHFIAGARNNKFSDARIDIFKKVIEENGIAFNESMVSYGEFWSLPAREAAQKLIDSGNIPEAVICANDVMAINVCDVFIQAGVKVPEQVIVTGFDGIEEALMCSPPLSTAGCDSTDLAEAVGKCVAAILNGQTPRDSFVIPRIAPNASCGCEYVPTDYSIKVNGINNKFYRYQDDIRMLYDVSTNIQMSETAQQASASLKHYLMHDLCCIVDSKCFNTGKNFFNTEETGGKRSVLYDAYHEDTPCIKLDPGELVPDLERRLNTGYPLIFNALDFMSKPFGYICYSYLGYDINEYSRTSSITNTVSMGFGGFVTLNYQRFLREKITKELKVAAEMQKNMMPSDFELHDRFEINASMIPAKNVGGDFYDFFSIDRDHLALVMADVSGKGVPAALFMAVSKNILHDRTLLSGTPSEILHDVNRQICKDNKMGLFITVWLGILDLRSGILTYANAGHEYPAIKDADGKFTLVTDDNMPPVGTMDDLIYEDNTIDMGSGGYLFIYTDGVTDVKNTEGEHFGINRMLNLLDSTDGKSPKEIIICMNEGIDSFAKDTERFDDTTMMCLWYKGAGK